MAVTLDQNQSFKAKDFYNLYICIFLHLGLRNEADTLYGTTGLEMDTYC